MWKSWTRRCQGNDPVSRWAKILAASQVLQDRWNFRLGGKGGPSKDLFKNTQQLTTDLKHLCVSFARYIDAKLHQAKDHPMSEDHHQEGEETLIQRALHHHRLASHWWAWLALAMAPDRVDMIWISVNIYIYIYIFPREVLRPHTHTYIYRQYIYIYM